MADQVVTLIDNEGTNLYPVAGALKSGSVTTSTINDDAVTAAKIDFSTLSGNYSTSEQDTGFTWVDGKHIYKKTINFGALPNNTNKDVAHGISNLERVIRIEGYACNTGLTDFLPLPYSANSVYPIDVSVVGSNVKIYTYTDRTSLVESYITLYYTKSS